MPCAAVDLPKSLPAGYPTIEVVVGDDGEPLYRVEALGMRCEHRQAWQAEAMLQQLAVARGVELPADWARSQLGGRSRPTP